MQRLPRRAAIEGDEAGARLRTISRRLTTTLPSASSTMRLVSPKDLPVAMSTLPLCTATSAIEGLPTMISAAGRSSLTSEA
jgi:hypothetical protein